jgi:hypothetical protein
MNTTGNYKGRWWDEIRCFVGSCKLYPVVVKAGASYQHGGLIVTATEKDVNVSVCPICSFARINL